MSFLSCLLFRQNFIFHCRSNNAAFILVSVRSNMTPKRLFTSIVIALGLAQLLQAGEHVYCKSPDGKFALRERFNDLNPIHGESAIIETSSGKVAVQLHGDEPVATEQLVWSKGSRRVASFRDADSGATRIFLRNGSTFDEIKMPVIAPPQLPQLPKTDASGSETIRRLQPIRWTESGDLLLEDEVQNKAGARAANEITLGFDDEHRTLIRKSEPEKMSILDYFLLLPPKTLENPADEWLQVMRANGNVIDKENGYMSCPGDGAQPKFEVALFRYRNGKPLLALCTGELEGDDSLFLYFFEMGANGKMDLVRRWLFSVCGRIRRGGRGERRLPV